MKENAIRARAKKGKFKATTDSSRNLPVCENLLKRNFKPSRTDTVWTDDVTYIPTGNGWRYVAVVIDVFSRQLVGWAMGGAAQAQGHVRRQLNGRPAHQTMAGKEHIHAQKKRFKPKNVNTRK